jgi:ribosome-associated protein
MIEVNEDIRLDEAELTWEFVRSSGPGGQNVNKVSTAAQLRFNVAGSPSLPDDVRQRLIELAGARVTSGGELIITAQRYRSQARNRQEAVDRLVELIREAARPPRKRKRTRPSRSAREQRLEAKRRRSEKKDLRKRIRPRTHTDGDDGR